MRACLAHNSTAIALAELVVKKEARPQNARQQQDELASKKV